MLVFAIASICLTNICLLVIELSLNASILDNTHYGAMCSI
jgi:hypothetical protein